jgi:opacity protein-like surface antigen
MKKVLFVSALFLFAVSSKSIAQDDNGGAWGGQGTIVVNAGYGFGNIWKNLFKFGSLYTSNSVKATGPLALGFEYGVAEKIGIGLQLGYSQIKSTATDKDGIAPGKDYIETSKLTAIQALARANYHFGSSAKFDPYIGLGVGYGNFKFSVTDNDPASVSTFNISVPGAFGFSGALGARYYFSPNIGIYAEVGYVSGSVAQAGLVAKF